jgi:uncharacterized protein YjbK
MISNIEIEAKVLLKKEDYEKLSAYLGVSDANSYTQVNYYIDSKSRVLKANDIALRIREKRGSYEMTLKTPLSEGLLEKNQDLSAKEALEMINLNHFPSGEIKEFLEIFDIDTADLVILAKMTTLRSELKNTENDETISLDMNSYGGTVDFELEVDETSMASAEKKVDEIMKANHISYKMNPLSKATRALTLAEKNGFKN